MFINMNSNRCLLVGIWKYIRVIRCKVLWWSSTFSSKPFCDLIAYWSMPLRTQWNIWPVQGYLSRILLMTSPSVLIVQPADCVDDLMDHLSLQENTSTTGHTGEHQVMLALITSNLNRLVKYIIKPFIHQEIALANQSFCLTGIKHNENNTQVDQVGYA